MADILKPDLCVIGGGSDGIALALGASRRGLNTVLATAPETVGNGPGDSLRRAALQASAARAQAIRTAGQVGLDNAAPKLNFRRVTEHAIAVASAAESRDSEARLTALGVTVLDGAAVFLDKQTLRCGDETIRARQFVLATGAKPIIPALPGIDQVAYFTPASIADNIRKLTHLVVIGGTPAAFELAQAYCRLGSMVTLVPQGGLLPGFDPELTGLLIRVLREEGVVVLDDAEVSAIVPRSQGTGVTLRRADGEDSLDVSHILIAMDSVPNLDTGLLDKARLKRDRLHPDHLLIGPDGQTSNAKISVIGGAAGHVQPHIVTRQISLLIERLLGQGKGRLDLQRVPRLVQTQPSLAQTGVLHPLGERSGQKVWRSNGAESDAVRAANDPVSTIKLVTSDNGAVLGVGAFGMGASELVGLMALAMARGLPIAELGALALPAASLASPLADIADQYLAQKPKRRLPGLGRILR